MIQASAGTGKSYLLESLFLWSLIHGGQPQACAPTGIAAARIFVPRTAVKATTFHNLFQLSVDLESKIDPGNNEHIGTQKLLKMTFLIIDEASMLDDGAWRAIRDQLSSIGHKDLREAGVDGARHPRRDSFGRVHILMCCDYKQLPPATGNPPFIATDPEFIHRFEFRVLRQNRRLSPAHDVESQASLDEFHGVLEDVAHGKACSIVRKYIVDAYVRGAERPTASHLWKDEGTACFTKRKYRDRWNKKVQDKVARKYKRSLRVAAVFSAANNPERVLGGRAVKSIRRVVRNQCPLMLHLAGQWHSDDPAPMEDKPFLMRAMLVANIDVENRFANGTQGRIVQWSPEVVQSEDKDDKAPTVNATDAEVMVRFVHEHALRDSRRNWVSGIDFIDIMPRSEEVPKAKGKPRMTQLQVIAANALTIHKIQALTILHNVFGCFEGVFAAGQVYVLWSRVTKSMNFHLVGLPPLDMLDEMAKAWQKAGYNVNQCFQKAVDVTNDWIYTPASPEDDVIKKIASRLTAKFNHQRRVPLRLKTVQQILNPQPTTARVLHELLQWIDDEDRASQQEANQTNVGSLRPEIAVSLFKDAPENWWMTEFERRKPPDESSSSEDDDDVKSVPDEPSVDSTDTESAGEPMTQQDKRVKTTHAAPADISPLVSPAGLACAKHPPNAVHASACSSSSSFETSRKQDTENADPSTKKQKTTSSNAARKFTLQGSCMGVQLDKPSWYMQRESQAVMPMGTQSLATCGLHAVNHALHTLPGFRCRT